MDSLLVYLVIGITLGSIILLGFFFLRNSKKSSIKSKSDTQEFEDQVLELVSKFQHISATRLNALEIKVKEVQDILKESNEIYLKLTSVIAEAGRERIEIEKLINFLDKKEIPIPLKKVEHEIKENEKIEYKKDIEKIPEEESDLDLTKSSLEHQILNLSSEGMSTDDIARKLGVGRGEVQLVQELFRRKFG